MQTNKMFQDCQIDEDTYKRIQLLDEDEPFFQENSYEQFIKWNNECFDKLSVDQRNWVLELCRLLNMNSFKVFDEEICIEWDAEWVFFNKNGKICVMHPR
jgi:hypothetical protein